MKKLITREAHNYILQRFYERKKQLETEEDWWVFSLYFKYRVQNIFFSFFLSVFFHFVNIFHLYFAITAAVGINFYNVCM